MLPRDFIDKFKSELGFIVVQTNREYEMTPISRLRDKLGKAAGVAQRVAAGIEGEADALIAKEDAMKSKTNSAFAPHHAILAEANTELQAIEDALNLMSNGGPALDPLDVAAPTAPDSPSTKYPTYP